MQTENCNENQPEVQSMEYDDKPSKGQSEKKTFSVLARILIYVLLLITIIVVLITMFGGTISQVLDGITKSVCRDGYFCEKCNKFHDLSRFRDIAGARWCRNCCTTVPAGVVGPYAHRCTRGGQHTPGSCSKPYHIDRAQINENVNEARMADW